MSRYKYLYFESGMRVFIMIKKNATKETNATSLSVKQSEN